MKASIYNLLRVLVVSCLAFAASANLTADEPAATRPLQNLPEEPAAEMVAGIDRFLLQQLALTGQQRDKHWQERRQWDENRQFLIQQLGLEPQRYSPTTGFLHEDSPVHSGDTFTATHVRWPVLGHPAPQAADAVGMWGEAIHLRPHAPAGRLTIVMPDADELPESWLFPLEVESDDDQHAWQNRRVYLQTLAQSGTDVIIVATVNRGLHQHNSATMTRREYLHRAAFELGRTLTGYEIQTIQSLLDRFADYQHKSVYAAGESINAALMATAIDSRVDSLTVEGLIGTRANVWSEPISRQIFGLHNRFDNAHLLALIAPRKVTVIEARNYSIELPGGGGAPATWQSPDRAEYEAQLVVLREVCKREGLTLSSWFNSLPDDAHLMPHRNSAIQLAKSSNVNTILAQASRRSDRLFDTIDAYNQLLLTESEYEREGYLNIGLQRNDHETNVVDASSIAAYQDSIEPFRDDFRENVIGWYDEPLLAPDPRSTVAFQGESWTAHHVMLDVFPDVFAYGILLLPNDIQPTDSRPVVVCQHGLEGRPEDTIRGDHRAYHDYAAKLADMGYVVFAPQNPYIGQDKFRTLQRKSYPMGKTLFSVIGAQHQQILGWLKTVPGVNADKIAFYGLSYGGKSAMRLPALLPDYCLSICSADFNDWVWKNASSRSRYSYIGTGEYEIFEFGLGKKFNYAEMAALIAPRPFMVERGHHDGVAPDDRVAKEFAKVRYLYEARLQLADRCEIEWFNGPHTINGQGTFQFLEKHLGKAKD
ncbi:alpha/beta hydrolase family protein [Stieleria varia]|uniref:Alpha/beta hydrolase family protein n=1 Tax=Stieleria varia TaxID=2528005 RepID=A0A5C6A2Z2_9BACT|nr:alpha/beta hydrolase family protein [Stieleria varia]TWT93735.1 Alpha/beta hydrolase family protein [Stieleria varia]